MTPRLYINGPLHAGLPAPLSAEQAHYLKNVLRRAEGDALLLFNGKDGEFAATIAELKKKSGFISHRSNAGRWRQLCRKRWRSALRVLSR